MPLYGAWRKWSGKLATSTDRDFERKTLPFLRLFWPSLHQLPARGAWDAKGIDLLDWVDNGSFPCGVQCKGFEVQELGNDQLSQVLKSIESFEKSDAQCDTYLIVHNRDARNTKFNDKINERLRHLVSTGKVLRAELWDRQTLLLKSYNRLKKILNNALHAHSQEILARFQSIFEFGRYHIARVPAAEKRLIFKRGEPCIVKEVRSISSCEISKIILSPSEARWTLLTGMFGTGKTTAVLYAATASDQNVIFVQCATLPGSSPSISTNVLMEEIVKSLRVFDDFEDQDREILHDLAGPTLGDVLKKSDTSYALVLDGLDENRAYTNLAGLQRLSNQLADLESPVILTTRTEHLNSMFGDFSLAFDEFSTKKGPQRNARLLELLQWEKPQVLQLAKQTVEGATGTEKKRLSEFMKLVESDQYMVLYDELPFNPLFLQFILEDVAAEGIQLANRVLLLYRWVKRKIYRDRKAMGRLTPDDSADVEDFVDRMIHLMENIAHAMTYKIGYTYKFGEFIDSVLVTKEAQMIFNDNTVPILGILLNSVLMPQAARSGAKLDVMFAYKVFHEYFLASYIVRENRSDDGYPETVKSFCSEIRANRIEDALHKL